MLYPRALAAVLASAVSVVAWSGHMEEVIVSGSHEKRTIDVVDEIAIVADTAQLLKQAPGANVNMNGPLTGIPQYRGMYGPRVGVQLNGMQLAPAGPNWMDPPLSYAAAAQLESLQLYRGIAPVSVVQESIGGAVNAVTARGEFSDTKVIAQDTHLVATGQSVNNGTLLGATVLASNEMHRVRVAAMTENGDDAEFARGKILPTEYERDRYELGYGLRVGSHTLQFNYTRSETGDAGTPALPMDIELIDGDLYSLGYNFSGSGWSLDATLFGSELDHTMTNYHLRQAPLDNAMWRRNTTTASNRGFKLAATFNDDHGLWMVGADGLDSSHNSDIDNPQNPAFYVVNFNAAERSIVGLFAERQHDFGNAWSAELGLRYNHVVMNADEVDGTPAMMPAGAMLRDAFNAADRKQTDDNIDVVAKAFYRANDQLSYYAGLARKTRSPSYQERYLWLPLQATGGLADGLTYTGNIELEPEVAGELELGLDFNNGNLVLSPRLFYRDVKDFIQGVPSSLAPATMLVAMMNANNGTNNPAPLQFDNVDAVFWGFDMDWRYTVNAAWSWSGLVNYVRGERDDISDNLYRIAPLNGSLAVDYSGHRWGARLEARLYADQDKVSNTNNEQPSDGYGVLNLGGYWRATDAARVAVGVDNVLDENYADHLSGVNRVAGNADVARGERLPGYGRNAFVRLDITF